MKALVILIVLATGCASPSKPTPRRPTSPFPARARSAAPGASVTSGSGNGSGTGDPLSARVIGITYYPMTGPFPIVETFNSSQLPPVTGKSSLEIVSDGRHTIAVNWAPGASTFYWQVSTDAATWTTLIDQTNWPGFGAVLIDLNCGQYAPKLFYRVKP